MVIERHSGARAGFDPGGNLQAALAPGVVTINLRLRHEGRALGKRLIPETKKNAQGEVATNAHVSLGDPPKSCRKGESVYIESRGKGKVRVRAKVVGAPTRTRRTFGSLEEV